MKEGFCRKIYLVKVVPFDDNCNTNFNIGSVWQHFQLEKCNILFYLVNGQNGQPAGWLGKCLPLRIPRQKILVDISNDSMVQN